MAIVANYVFIKIIGDPYSELRKKPYFEGNVSYGLYFYALNYLVHNGKEKLV